MKHIISILFMYLISSICHAECQQAEPVAEKFLNDYVQFCENKINKKIQQSGDEWLAHHAKLTRSFKKYYVQLVKKAEQEEPELGLDFDPIFNAQEYPEQGFNVASCDEKTNIVTLTGRPRGWEEFQVKIKVINTPKGWLIDGAGVINMPK